MQCQKSGKEQKYFTTFQAISRVTKEEGVRNTYIHSQFKDNLIPFVDSFSVCIAAWQPPCVQLLLPTLSRLGFMESLAEMLEILRY